MTQRIRPLALAVTCAVLREQRGTVGV